jgi:hypothetical protein
MKLVVEVTLILRSVVVPLFWGCLALHITFGFQLRLNALPCFAWKDALSVAAMGSHSFYLYCTLHRLMPLDLGHNPRANESLCAHQDTCKRASVGPRVGTLRSIFANELRAAMDGVSLNGASFGACKLLKGIKVCLDLRVWRLRRAWAPFAEVNERE